MSYPRTVCPSHCQTVWTSPLDGNLHTVLGNSIYTVYSTRTGALPALLQLSKSCCMESASFHRVGHSLLPDFASFQKLFIKVSSVSIVFL